MIELRWRRVITTAAFVAAASGASTLAREATAATQGEKAGAERSTQAALVSLETSAYAAWKSKNAKFWENFLSNKFVGWGSTGRLDKASAKTEYSGADCDIKSFAISDVQLSPLGREVALITHKTTVDGICGGQKRSPATWAATAYVRESHQWKAAFHTEAAIVDPAAPPAKLTGRRANGEQKQAASAASDGRTDELLVREKAIWEAWKDHDAKRLNDLTATDLQFINIFGIHLTTKAEALKNWSGEGCDVKSIALTDASATMLSPTIGILTFRASADGTCFGQTIGPVWGSSIYVKDGDRWMWNFGVNVPASQEGG